MKHSQTSYLVQFAPNIDHQTQIVHHLYSQKKIPSQSLNQPNLHWINPQKETLKIQTVRELISQVSYSSYGDTSQWFVLLYADLATLPAQNSLLKFIEEPPADTQVILTVTNPEKLLPTIRSRCQNMIIPIQDISQKTQEKGTSNTTVKQLEPFLHFFSKPSTHSYAQLIEMAEPFKERSSALQLLFDLLCTTTSQKNSFQYTLVNQELLKSYQQLEKNAHVLLTLENCLFTIKKYASL